MNRLVSILTFSLFLNVCLAQGDHHILKGYVKESSSGDLLPYAHVYVTSESKGVISNAYGFFSIPVLKPFVELKISYTGYQPLNVKFNIHTDTLITCLLESNNVLEEVTILRDPNTQNLNQEVGSITLMSKQLDRIPTLFGEKDIAKAIQLIPGVKMGKEGTSGLYVRGGTPGQNLYLLDGVPVYHIDHVSGLFSVFTPECVKRVDFYKGAFPAAYAGRISSVVDIKMKEGNIYKKQTDITVGTISSKLVFETPIKKGKSSLMFSARRTYLDLLLTPFLKANTTNGYNKTAYNFYDLNLKLFFDLGSWGRIYWSNYGGKDTFNSESSEVTDSKNNLKQETSLDYHWGNLTSALRWNKDLGQKIFLNTTLYYTQYGVKRTINELSQREMEKAIRKETLHYFKRSNINDFGAKIDIDWYLNPNNHLNFGTKVTTHKFIPTDIYIQNTVNDSTTSTYSQEQKSHGYEFNTYIEDQLLIGKHVELTPGLHHAFYTLNSNRYNSFQPRLRCRFSIKELTFKLSYGYMIQPIHNITDNYDIIKTMLWMPSEAHIKPSTSNQFDAGVSKTISSSWNISFEGYYRKMNNILTYHSKESFIGIYEKWYDKVSVGVGTAYGVEFLLNKMEGKTQGWIGYTWAINNQQFDDINNGNFFPATHDRRHQLTITGTHQLSQNIQLSANWVYASGEPITLSTTAYTNPNENRQRPISYSTISLFEKDVYAPNQIIDYPTVNNARLPAYHRLDAGINFEKQKPKGIRTWSLSVYNLYGRNNPYLVNFSVNQAGETVLKNTTFYKFLPSIAYRYKFN